MNINNFLASIYSLLVVIIIISSMATTAEAQNLKLLEGFTIEKELSATSVKNQAQSGTCWSFASLSFMESEALRMGNGEYEEMGEIGNGVKGKIGWGNKKIEKGENGKIRENRKTGKTRK